ncbi:hypothetical protein [Paenibacillus sp. MZ03-122A]|uniref:hypothetical protein n=1 Tax=Paenibacillus sp. MZ03-122A TaxID=2962033 RepID=UPI0020B84BAA|nr:hypothetical protein [Paenibacillus sp. MZ03-122A]
MKPIFIPHSDYQAFVLLHLRSSYGSGVVPISKDWPLGRQTLDDRSFNGHDFALRRLFSSGAIPRDPASLFCSYLPLLLTNPHMGITEWINEMKRTPIYAILSGFPLDYLPGVSTFYGFFRRLWPAVDQNLKPKKQRQR